MPDWSYQTVFRPLFFRMVPRKAQQLAIGSLGRLGSTAAGRFVIQFMGHMVPPSWLAFESGGVRFPSRVGLCCGLDSLARASGGLDQFGFAFNEIGPLTESECPTSRVELEADAELVTLESPEQNPGLEVLSKPLHRDKTPLLVRFDASVPAATIWSAIRRFTEQSTSTSKSSAPVDGFVIPYRTWPAISELISKADAAFNTKQVLLLALVPADLNDEQIEVLMDVQGCDGILVDGSLSDSRSIRALGKANLAGTLRCVKQIREIADESRLIIASGGVHEPADAHAIVQAGANIVGVDSGMVFAGPGLAKRSNELLAQTIFAPSKGPNQESSGHPLSEEDRPARQSWFWALLMGVSMLGGGLLALVIALTRVVLPYDEATVGMTREQLIMLNDKLIDFMAHDRVTLAGTMLSVGTLYSGLAFFGMRNGAHWASKSIVVSAFVGFFSFFLFLGFGYFDPFHAFVTAILFQFLVLTVYSRLAKPGGPVRLDPVNDDRWRRGLWGQLMYLCQGAALIVAGSVISCVGITSVFVKEDMEFMCTTPDRLIEANPQLLSLVAHDRATFGGMLICAGITISLAALWGFRRGHAWLWWTLFVSGLFGYVCTIFIHLKVGYTSTKHLLPAYGGLVWLCLAAGLSYSYLHDRITTWKLGS